MPSSNQPSTSTISDKDAMSMRSTSTIASTKALLKSLLPSRKSKAAVEDRTVATPAQQAQQKATKAEALHAWALHR
ncbi:hypothetical protein L13192_07835 [Pyrenophora tritici-repentis]|uniref:Uncharacterized protein n=1 Tax=Pyrenophora tritici-repentis TaxID=45151 RepID=A0A317AMT5_9PLEO|nr:hypothetical protein Ptr86124_011874 [Pyrenophora tritici-repentis]KAI1668699.1 hypothetical protein L13192_07835 [Pyrenophora tritici-repentis]KAI1680476.1 hypothetical protein KJE20_09327 [Pyrenophora tritici-repentis]